METQANYALIGAFALAGLLGILGFFFWFANVQLDRQFAYYDIDFESVSGLSDASDVRFSGLPVGQVVDVRLSPANDGRVRVRIEIDADTPVREDSVATIEAQGVTGVAFIGISSGSVDADLLGSASNPLSDDLPMIRPGRSVLQSLSQDAPEILDETLAAVRDFRAMIGDENRERVEAILLNIERSSASFADALDDFSAISGTVSSFAAEIERFNRTLVELTQDASGVLTAAETALVSLNTLSTDARDVLTEGAATLDQAQATLATADLYVQQDLRAATLQLTRSLSEFETRFAALSENASQLLATYEVTGDTATAGLNEARDTLVATNALIARIEATLASVDAAATSFDTLLADGAEPLVAELRQATAAAGDVIAMIGATAETDLPAILAAIRDGAETASRTITRVGEDLSSASGNVAALTMSADRTLEATRETFANANATLSAINAALVTGDRALSAAETAFRRVDGVLNEDVEQIVRTLGATLAKLETSVGQVATDIPLVTEDLRDASRSAQATFAQIAGVVDQSAPALREFSATALPQYNRLATETRDLINNLDTLVDQIRRNPSRFFLDPRAPEFAR